MLVSADKTNNHLTAKDYVKRAATQGAQLVVLPEIWNSPYSLDVFSDYAEVLPEVDMESLMEKSPSAAILRELAVEYKIWLVGGSITERIEETDYDDDGKEILYNTCLVFDPSGNIVCKHRKIHLSAVNLPNGVTLAESDTFTPGNAFSYFDSPFGRIGIGICNDIRFAEYALILTEKYQCRILVYPGAFNLWTGQAHWELLQRARAVDNQCYVIWCAPARTKEPIPPGNTWQFWGHSTIVDPLAQVVATTDECPGIVMADLDLQMVEDVRASICVVRQKRKDMYKFVDITAAEDET